MPSEEIRKTWEAARAELKRRNPERFDNFLKQLDLVRATGHSITLSAPSAFLRQWVEKTASREILAILQETMPAMDSVLIERRSAERGGAPSQPPPPRSTYAPAPPQPKESPAPQVPEMPINGDAVDGRMTFDRFIPGTLSPEDRELLVSIATQRRPGAPARTLVLGEAGTGKTHALSAAVLEARARGRRAVYAPPNWFRFNFAVALQRHPAAAMRALERIDVFVLDDFNLFQGTSAQVYAMGVLLTMPCDILLASTHPTDATPAFATSATLDEAFAEMTVMKTIAPDEIARHKIVDIHADQATRLSAPLPGEIRDFIAAQTAGRTPRTVVAAVQRAIQICMVNMRTPIGSLQTAVTDLLATKPQRTPLIEDVIREVAAYFDVPIAEMKGTRRHAKIVRPRQIAMYVAKVTTGRSLPEIGRRFGGRDHTTVIHAFNKIVFRMSNDEKLRAVVADLCRRVEERKNG